MTWRVSAARAPCAAFPRPGQASAQCRSGGGEATPRDRRAAGSSGPRTRSRPARGRSSSGIDSAARLASQTAGGPGTQAAPPARYADHEDFARVITSAAVHQDCTGSERRCGHKEIRPRRGCTPPGARGVKRHGRMRGRRTWAADTGRPCRNHRALPGAPAGQ